MNLKDLEKLVISNYGTKKAFAEILGIRRETLWHMFTGKVKPRPEIRKKLNIYLGINTETVTWKK